MQILEQSAQKPALEVSDVMALLPHRYPFLMLDRVLELERRKRIVAIKNISINEPYFQGHFPDYPIMPGVLVIESIAQAGGVLVLLDISNPQDKLMVFTGIERAKFRLPAVPGDQLRIEANVLQWRSRAVRIEGKVTIDGKVACEAIITCGLKDRVARIPGAAMTEAAPEAIPQVEAEAAHELATASVE